MTRDAEDKHSFMNSPRPAIDRLYHILFWFLFTHSRASLRMENISLSSTRQRMARWEKSYGLVGKYFRENCVIFSQTVNLIVLVKEISFFIDYFYSP